MLTMSFQIARKLFTTEDCCRLAEIGVLSPQEPVELIQGEVVLMTPRGPREGMAVDGAIETLIQQMQGKARVRVREFVVLDQLTAPVADIALLASGSNDILLIVEVSDTTLEYDIAVKLPLYAHAGIPEYWIADLRNDVLISYSQPADDSYRVSNAFRRGESVSPLLLPESRIPVDLLLP
jgi:Uma2 family endonuclease